MHWQIALCQMAQAGRAAFLRAPDQGSRMEAGVACTRLVFHAASTLHHCPEQLCHEVCKSDALLLHWQCLCIALCPWALESLEWPQKAAAGDHALCGLWETQRVSQSPQAGGKTLSLQVAAGQG